MDLIMEIKRIISSSPFPITGEWVRSHAERHKHPPSPEQLLNMEADCLAAQHRTSPDDEQLLPPGRALILLGNKPVTKEMTSSLEKWIGDQKVHHYWKNKSSLPDPNIVNLASIKEAWTHLSQHERTTMSKILYGWSYTGERATAIDNRVFLCPCCQQEEKGLHIWECPSAEMLSIRKKRLQELRLKLSNKPPMFPVIEIVNIIAAFPEKPHPHPTLRDLDLFQISDIAKGFLPSDIQIQIDEINTSRARSTDHGKGILLYTTHMWKTLLLLWKKRCETKYGAGPIGRTNANRERLLHQAQRLKPVAELCHDHEARLAALDSLHDKSIPAILGWIEATEARGQHARNKQLVIQRTERRVRYWRTKGINLPGPENFVNDSGIDVTGWTKEINDIISTSNQSPRN